jgi:hypothetical protein
VPIPTFTGGPERHEPRLITRIWYDMSTGAGVRLGSGERGRDGGGWE